ncbi:DUF5133 domain-containing protein [Streptomyces longwoodensis]
MMLLPAEKDLRAALARFAQVRIEHDVRPTGTTSLALEDVTRALCTLTGATTVEDALREADALLDRCRTARVGAAKGTAPLAA